MKYLTSVWNLLLYKFPLQFNKFRFGAFLSTIIVLNDTDSEHVVSLKEEEVQLGNQERLQTGERFAVAGLVWQVAKAPLTAGAGSDPVTAGLDWKDYVDPAVWTTEAQQVAVRQLFQSKFEVWRGEKKITLQKSVSAYMHEGSLAGAPGAYGNFAPVLPRYILNGDTESDYKVKLILPTDAVKDQYAGADYVMVFRPRFVGVGIGSLCGTNLTSLNMIPSACDGTTVVNSVDECTCNHDGTANTTTTTTTTTTGTGSQVTMIVNPNDDLGYIYWTLQG